LKNKTFERIAKEKNVDIRKIVNEERKAM